MFLTRSLIGMGLLRRREVYSSDLVLRAKRTKSNKIKVRKKRTRKESKNTERMKVGTKSISLIIKQ